ncbi:MAG: dTMP kinase [Deltaproteobacteria bacterium]|nr:MAG: dTMP kinase [Deltaproteobacteria bacterium]
MFITFEGIEGCGKSTQAARLVDRLNLQGIPTLLTCEPGGTPIGKGIRAMLLDTQNRGMSPETELLLYAADRAQHVREVIRPALGDGRWVVCDRFFDATTAYQGYGRGQDLSWISTLNEKAICGVRPDMTILVDCPVSIGIQRALARVHATRQEKQARFENEDRPFHEAVRKGYLEIAEREPKRFIVVDGTLGENELEEKIFEHVSARI